MNTTRQALAALAISGALIGAPMAAAAPSPTPPHSGGFDTHECMKKYDYKECANQQARREGRPVPYPSNHVSGKDRVRPFALIAIFIFGTWIVVKIFRAVAEVAGEAREAYREGMAEAAAQAEAERAASTAERVDMTPPPSASAYAPPSADYEQVFDYPDSVFNGQAPRASQSTHGGADWNDILGED